MVAVEEYDAKVDSRNRITLRGADYKHYHVTKYDDGSLKLEPLTLINPNTVSGNTLSMMDEAMSRLRDGKVSEALDPDELAD